MNDFPDEPLYTQIIDGVEIIGYSTMAFALRQGFRYRLSDEVKIGRCVFQRGDVLIYSSGGYSHYDDSYVYEFIDPSGERRVCSSKSELIEAQQAKFELMQ